MKFDIAVLAGLQSHRHIYAGTVPYEEVKRRRAKNKRARASRKASRKAARRG